MGQRASEMAFAYRKTSGLSRWFQFEKTSSCECKMVIERCLAPFADSPFRYTDYVIRILKTIPLRSLTGYHREGSSRCYNSE